MGYPLEGSFDHLNLRCWNYGYQKASGISAHVFPCLAGRSEMARQDGISSVIPLRSCRF